MSKDLQSIRFPGLSETYTIPAPDLSSYATKTYVQEQVAGATASVDIDNATIIEENGVLKTAVGGSRGVGSPREDFFTFTSGDGVAVTQGVVYDSVATGVANEASSYLGKTNIHYDIVCYQNGTVKNEIGQEWAQVEIVYTSALRHYFKLLNLNILGDGYGDEVLIDQNGALYSTSLPSDFKLYTLNIYIPEVPAIYYIDNDFIDTSYVATVEALNQKTSEINTSINEINTTISEVNTKVENINANGGVNIDNSTIVNEDGALRTVIGGSKTIISNPTIWEASFEEGREWETIGAYDYINISDNENDTDSEIDITGIMSASNNVWYKMTYTNGVDEYDTDGDGDKAEVITREVTSSCELTDDGKIKLTNWAQSGTTTVYLQSNGYIYLGVDWAVANPDFKLYSLTLFDYADHTVYNTIDSRFIDTEYIATRDWVQSQSTSDGVNIDGQTIISDGGALKTAIGGYRSEGAEREDVAGSSSESGWARQNDGTYDYVQIENFYIDMSFFDTIDQSRIRYELICYQNGETKTELQENSQGWANAWTESHDDEIVLYLGNFHILGEGYGEVRLCPDGKLYSTDLPDDFVLYTFNVYLAPQNAISYIDNDFIDPERWATNDYVNALCNETMNLVNERTAVDGFTIFENPLRTAIGGGRFVIKEQETFYFYNRADGSEATTKFEDTPFDEPSSLIIQNSNGVLVLKDNLYFRIRYSIDGGDIQERVQAVDNVIGADTYTDYDFYLGDIDTCSNVICHVRDDFNNVPYLTNATGMTVYEFEFFIPEESEIQYIDNTYIDQNYMATQEWVKNYVATSIVLQDTSTGTQYRLTVKDGVINLEAVTE